MILLIDNYDSFTYNAANALGELHGDVKVVRNDRITVDEAERLSPDYIVISPGPGRPENAGISMRLIDVFSGKIPILGICLGHQCIAQFFGSRITYAERLLHGKTSRIYHDSKSIYNGLRNPVLAGRYHSLIVEEDSIPECLEISAYTAEGEIMGLRHRELPVEGVQFHPESILTEDGMSVFRNFLNGGSGK
ncbi:MAG: anthranilate synthase component II [Planctomycetota bacterium]|jgi:anthranilate synthase/aminodeoxychorismate synthase-like glutamine amidotransferase